MSQNEDGATPTGQPAEINNPEAENDKRVYTQIKALLLTFEFHDLRGLDNETEEVANSFRSLGYGVKKFRIPMQNSQDKLITELTTFLGSVDEDSLAILYYHGHGGLSRTHESLVFSSHNFPKNKATLQNYLKDLYIDLSGIEKSHREMRKPIESFQPIAEVAWRKISNLVVEAKCDTLIILDCCEAGLASVHALSGDGVEDNQREEGEWLQFRKELIAACAWDNETGNRMSKELCNALEKLVLKEEGARISGFTLIREMNNRLADHFLKSEDEDQDEEDEDEDEDDEDEEDKEHVAQALHFLLRRTLRDKILLEAH